MKVNGKDEWLEAKVIKTPEKIDNIYNYQVMIIDRHDLHGRTSTKTEDEMQKSKNTLYTYKKGDIVEIMNGPDFKTLKEWVKAKVTGIKGNKYKLEGTEGEHEDQYFTRFPYELRNTLETFKKGEVVEIINDEDSNIPNVQWIKAKVFANDGGNYHLKTANAKIFNRLPNEIRRPINNE
ncbi:hypothetical protein ACQ4LE_008250 [Meloidogyne hapla]